MTPTIQMVTEPLLPIKSIIIYYRAINDNLTRANPTKHLHLQPPAFRHSNSFTKEWLRFRFEIEDKMADSAPKDNSRRYKFLMTVSLLLHAVLLTPTFTKVVVEVRYGTPMDLRGYTVTTPVPWEYFWSSSSIFILCGLYALLSHNVYKLSLFIVGNVLLSIGPVIWSIAALHHNKLRGSTVDNRWFAFSLFCLAVHCFSVYYAAVLRKDWKAKQVLTRKSR